MKPKNSGIQIFDTSHINKFHWNLASCVARILKNVVCYRKDKAAGTQFLPSPCDKPCQENKGVFHMSGAYVYVNSHIQEKVLLSKSDQWLDLS